jgi:hypothetical protein
MKKLILFSLLAMPALAAFATVDPSDSDKARCYMEDPEARTITFIFDNAQWKVSNLKSVEVKGSFTSWNSDDRFALTADTDRNFWYVTVSYDDVSIPGNSGQPEFKFVTNGSTYQNGGSKSFIPEGYVFLNGDKNNIIVFADDDFDTIKANSKSANVLKKVADFDLTTVEGQEEISNFRCVPGTAKLFRSYHPFKYSKTTNATEPVRIQYVTELAVANGIKSDICLSGDDTSSLKSYTISGTKYTETIPDYYQQIIDGNHVLYVGTVNETTPSYNAVYYRSTNETFCQWVKEIVDFINDDNNQAPFLIHCRLGTDRTGVFCGVLAALCGASWNEIATDYQLTNRMGIQEFRDYHLLAYSFRQILGVQSMNDVESISDSLCAYFIGNGTLTQGDIDKLRTKLGSTTTGIKSVDTASHLRYDAQSESILLPEQFSGATLSIYTSTGILESQTTVSDREVSLSGLARGLYIARLVTPNGDTLSLKLRK